MTADPPRRRPRPTPPPPAGGAGGRSRTAGRNLPVAIASGLALAGIFVAAVLVEALVALGIVAVLMGLALYELHVGMRGKGWHPATPVVAGAGLVMLFGAYLHGPSALAVGLVLAMAGTVVWALLAERLVRRPEADGAAPDAGGHAPATAADGGSPAGVDARIRGPAADIAASALMTCWVPLTAAFIGVLLARPDGGAWYLLAAIALSVSNDIGAYAFGNRFGRSKIAPHVSPAKTWEGFLGGLGTVVVLAVLVTSRGAAFTVGIAVVFGVAVVVAGTVGDLAESLVKRDLGVKDLGAVIPGHGGVMDRVDGILFAMPTAHIVLTLFGL